MEKVLNTSQQRVVDVAKKQREEKAKHMKKAEKAGYKAEDYKKYLSDKKAKRFWLFAQVVTVLSVATFVFFEVLISI